MRQLWMEELIAKHEELMRLYQRLITRNVLTPLSAPVNATSPSNPYVGGSAAKNRKILELAQKADELRRRMR